MIEEHQREIVPSKLTYPSRVTTPFVSRPFPFRESHSPRLTNPLLRNLSASSVFIKSYPGSLIQKLLSFSNVAAVGLSSGLLIIESAWLYSHTSNPLAPACISEEGKGGGILTSQNNHT